MSTNQLHGEAKIRLFNWHIGRGIVIPVVKGSLQGRFWVIQESYITCTLELPGYSTEGKNAELVTLV